MKFEGVSTETKLVSPYRSFIIPCDGVTKGVGFLLWRPSKMEAAAHTTNTPYVVIHIITPVKPFYENFVLFSNKIVIL